MSATFKASTDRWETSSDHVTVRYSRNRHSILNFDVEKEEINLLVKEMTECN